MCAFLVSSEFPHLCSYLFCSICFREARIRQCRIRSHPGHERWRMLRCWRLFGRMPRVSPIWFPFLKVDLHRAQEVAEEKFRSLSGMSAEGAWRLVVSEMERREQFEELSLLWAWGAKLCLTIIRPSQVKSPLFVRMRAAALCHTGVVGELTALRAAGFSTAELVLGCLPDETSQVEVMNELTTKF
jgi:hypothetical protein